MFADTPLQMAVGHILERNSRHAASLQPNDSHTVTHPTPTPSNLSMDLSNLSGHKGSTQRPARASAFGHQAAAVTELPGCLSNVSLARSEYCTICSARWRDSVLLSIDGHGEPMLAWIHMNKRMRHTPGLGRARRRRVHCRYLHL